MLHWSHPVPRCLWSICVQRIVVVWWRKKWCFDFFCILCDRLISSAKTYIVNCSSYFCRTLRVNKNTLLYNSTFVHNFHKYSLMFKILILLDSSFSTFHTTPWTCYSTTLQKHKCQNFILSITVVTELISLLVWETPAFISPDLQQSRSEPGWQQNLGRSASAAPPDESAWCH